MILNITHNYIILIKNQINGGILDYYFNNKAMKYCWVYSMKSENSQYIYLNLIKSLTNYNNEKNHHTSFV